MLTISRQEELTSNNSEFLIEDGITSLLAHGFKRNITVRTQSNTKSTTDVEKELLLYHQNARRLKLLKDYISQINKSQENNNREKILTLQEMWSKAAVAPPKESGESNIKITKDRLIELLKEDDEDDEGILKPTPHAFDKAWRLVCDASGFMKDSFPKAWVSTNDEGGIRLTWSQLEAETEVRLVCGAQADKSTYLYHEKGQKYGVVNDVSGLSLAGWLQWLNKV